MINIETYRLKHRDSMYLWFAEMYNANVLLWRLIWLNLSVFHTILEFLNLASVATFTHWHTGSDAFCVNQWWLVCDCWPGWTVHSVPQLCCVTRVGTGSHKKRQGSPVMMLTVFLQSHCQKGVTKVPRYRFKSYPALCPLLVAALRFSMTLTSNVL